MLNTLTIIGENALQVKVFAYYADRALNKLYLPDFNAMVRFMEGSWDDIEFTLELSEGISYSAKEFLRLQFALWTEKELLGNLYKFSIYSKDKQNITKIKFKVNLWREKTII
jgi:hypothetical protein